jgi:hypothetical protein
MCMTSMNEYQQRQYVTKKADSSFCTYHNSGCLSKYSSLFISIVKLYSKIFRGVGLVIVFFKGACVISKLKAVLKTAFLLPANIVLEVICKNPRIKK